MNSNFLKTACFATGIIFSGNGEQLFSAEQMTKTGADYLQQEIKERISKNTFRFKMYVQIAKASDKTYDPSIAWPDSRAKVLLGII